jgi:hypothetical protein
MLPQYLANKVTRSPAMTCGYLKEWRRAPDDATRAANIRRMKQTLPELRRSHRELFAGYTTTLEGLIPDNQGVQEIDDAFSWHAFGG